MRKGMIGLAMLVQQVLAEDPFAGALFAFRGRKAGLIKVLWHDGIGLCLLTKRLERGQFVWPSSGTRRGDAVSGAIRHVAGGLRMARAGAGPQAAAGRLTTLAKSLMSRTGTDAAALCIIGVCRSISTPCLTTLPPAADAARGGPARRRSCISRTTSCG